MEELDFDGLPGVRALGDTGGRPSVLLLHGVAGSHRDFDRYVRYLSSRGYDTYAVSRRGRLGTLPASARGVRIDDYVTDTLRTVEAIGGEVVLAGHSLGGLIAQKVAEAGQCTAAILLGSAPPRGVRRTPAMSTIPFFATTMPAVMTGRPYRLSYAFVSFVMAHRLPGPDRRRLHGRMVPESALVARELARGISVDRAKVTCPLLVIRGQLDRPFPPRVTRAIASAYRTEAVIVLGLDHWLIDEPGWERAATAVAALLKGPGSSLKRARRRSRRPRFGGRSTSEPALGRGCSSSRSTGHTDLGPAS